MTAAEIAAAASVAVAELNNSEVCEDGRSYKRFAAACFKFQKTMFGGGLGKESNPGQVAIQRVEALNRALNILSNADPSFSLDGLPGTSPRDISRSVWGGFSSKCRDALKASIEQNLAPDYATV